MMGDTGRAYCHTVLAVDIGRRDEEFGRLNFQLSRVFHRTASRSQYPLSSVQIWTDLHHFPVEQLQPGQKCPGSLWAQKGMCSKHTPYLSLSGNPLKFE